MTRWSLIKSKRSKIISGVYPDLFQAGALHLEAYGQLTQRRDGNRIGNLGDLPDTAAHLDLLVPQGHSN